MKTNFVTKLVAVVACLSLTTCSLFGAGVISFAADAPATMKVPAASGTTVLGTKTVVVDASNTSQGYVMIKYAGTNQKVKIQIAKSGGETYTYTVSKAGDFEIFPFSQGSGSYSVKVFESNASGKYTQAYSGTVDAKFENDYLPFLYPNQYVNYTADSKVVAKGAELCNGKTTTLDKVGAVYNYVVSNFTYDKNKAATVKSGYLPDVDKILESKTGICFDYAAVMASMLRSQGIPTKLVVGYAGKTYHAWLNVYSDKEGWIDKAVYFDGKNWKLMDPTFASSGKQSDAIMKYIGDGTNYTMKYVY